MVHILVGCQKTLFQLPKQLLIDVSTYFMAAFTSEFTEGKAQTVDMAENDTEMFKHFAYWLLTGSLYMTDTSTNDIEWGRPRHIDIAERSYRCNHRQERYRDAYPYKTALLHI